MPKHVKERRLAREVMAFGLEELARRLSVVDEADRPAVWCLELVLGVDAQLEVKDSRKVGWRDRASVGKSPRASVLPSTRPDGTPAPGMSTLLARP
jgi:hypothetical protein